MPSEQIETCNQILDHKTAVYKLIHLLVELSCGVVWCRGLSHVWGCRGKRILEGFFYPEGTRLRKQSNKVK